MKGLIALEKATESKPRANGGFRTNILLPLAVTTLIGGVCGLCSCFLWSFLLSAFEVLYLLPAFSLAVIFIAVSISALLTAKAFREDKLLMCAVSGAVWVMILILLNVIFFREEMTAMSIIRFAIAFFVPIGLSFCVHSEQKTKGRFGGKHKK